MLKTDLYKLKPFREYFETKKISEDSFSTLKESYADIIKKFPRVNSFWDEFVSKLKAQEGRKSYYEIINQRAAKNENNFLEKIKKHLKQENSNYLYPIKTLSEYECFFALAPLEVMIFANILKQEDGSEITIYLREDIGYTLSISYEGSFKINIFEEFTYEYRGELLIKELYVLLTYINNLTDKFGNISSLETEFTDINNLEEIQIFFQKIRLKKNSLR